MKVVEMGDRGNERVFDLTSCETCGMWWTAAKRELCPRCNYATALARLEEALHRLELAVAGVEPGR
jgi:hypothetical protein